MKENTVRPLVEETLTTEQLIDLFKLSEVESNPKFMEDHVSILKGWYETWDGERHDGCIVCHMINRPTKETANDFMPTYIKHYWYYFMEVTKELVNVSLSGRTYKVTYHALLPIHDKFANNPKYHPNNFEELANYIVANATVSEKWEYYTRMLTDEEIEKYRKKSWYVPSDRRVLIPVTKSDMAYWYEPLSDEEKAELLKQKTQKEEELISLFTNDTIPEKEDDAWYSILADVDSRGFGDYSLENKVIKLLRTRGHQVDIVGERDSFGWVTRGIEVDGVIMAII